MKLKLCRLVLVISEIKLGICLAEWFLLESGKSRTSQSKIFELKIKKNIRLVWNKRKNDIRLPKIDRKSSKPPNYSSICLNYDNDHLNLVKMKPWISIVTLISHNFSKLDEIYTIKQSKLNEKCKPYERFHHRHHQC